VNGALGPMNIFFEFQKVPSEIITRISQNRSSNQLLSLLQVTCKLFDDVYRKKILDAIIGIESINDQLLNSFKKLVDIIPEFKYDLIDIEIFFHCI
jgi:hypothetical protein